MDPGHVRTVAGGDSAPKSVEEGCALPMRLIEKEFKIDPLEQGKFFIDKGIVEL